AKKPSTTTCSSVSRSRVVETVLASRLEPREGTAIGACANPPSSNRTILALEAACTSARNFQESSRLPAAPSLAFSAYAHAKSLKPRGPGGLGGEASCDLIERGRNRYNDLAFREVPIPPLRPFGMQERVPEMLEVKA